MTLETGVPASYSQGRKSHSVSTIIRLLIRGLLQKVSKPERIVLEWIVTSFLQLQIDFCNKRLFRDCQLSLHMDGDEASKQTRCITR